MAPLKRGQLILTTRKHNGNIPPHAGRCQRKYNSNAQPAARVDGPGIAHALDARVRPVLVDEHPVGLDAALPVKLACHVAARAAAPTARRFAASGAGDGKNRVPVGGEVRHRTSPRQG